MMIVFLFLCVSFLAATIGVICGIGGGVIIKPVLDALGTFDVSTVNFLSGTTVLSMALYTVLSKRKEPTLINRNIGTLLAVGSIFGGILGNELFQQVAKLFSEKNTAGGVQAACLIFLTIGALLYTIYKNRIKTYKFTSPGMIVFIGLLLGLMSSFLGIGGGPFNLVILYFFFSMGTKEAAENSIYIILFSQLFSFIKTIIFSGFPDIDIILMLVMIAGGILGGMYGRKVNAKLNDTIVHKLFIGLMVIIIVINSYNMVNFLS